eukprot:CAMPEP_0201568454 /NCGR_PEP_ID=MMETSP0190_2-20130828/9550_1 /ASSEMBLY_ACC=CAM_ASM_000263 /TAXON_ID=37353 /ORGANISM="Rosalina sp." /LENGTH=291 /DNA_ID=CAMNT_0047989595 /DNA_START=33 /DNA_END=908 /DNA_ORIENTATION=+
MAAQANEQQAPAEQQAATEPGTEEKKETESGGGGFFNKLKAGAKQAGNIALEKGKEAKGKLDERLTMEGQLKQAAISLAKFLNPDLPIEEQIPVALMKDAKGIVFLSSVKVSMGFGGSVGSGVIISKLEYDQWSGPCSIGLLGGQWGFNIGAQKTDFIIILRDANAVKLFSGKGQIKFGADASIAAGPIGRDVQLAAGANDKGYAATVSYSQAKGLYVGVALEGQGIKVRDDCNEKYYGNKLSAQDILGCAADSGKNGDYDKIIELTTDYIKKIDDDAAKVIEGDNDDQPN